MLVRAGFRGVMAAIWIGCLTTLASWHADGLVRSGKIERMLRMGSGTAVAAAETKPRGRLDRGRLNALIATAGK